jgi:primosomal protein N' (replication factor Y)
MSQHLRIAKIILDSPLPHLDRLFDYSIPEEMIENCVPGVRVKVKFSGRNLEGWVIETTSLSNHPKKLSEVTKVISNYPVLKPNIVSLCQVVADNFIGNLSDVLRFAIPPRQAKIEKNFKLDSKEKITSDEVKISTIFDDENPKSKLSICFPPVSNYLNQIFQHIQKSKRSSLILFPNITLVDEFVVAFKNQHPASRVEILSAEQEPAQRYQSFLNILFNDVKLVVGTRNAIFAPLRDVETIFVWDDADENYFSPQGPYWNVREVAILRADIEKCKLIFFGHSESIAVRKLVEENYLKNIFFQDFSANTNWPQIVAQDQVTSDPLELSKRIPTKAWQIIKAGLERGNVLIQVPRLGYSSNLQCLNCRESVRCNSCSGPLSIKGKDGVPECKWCGKVATKWRCPYCHESKFRISVVGQTKTVEELGKSFPGVKIITSGGKTIIRNIDEKNSIVVATPGAEPRVLGGYAAAVLLDAYLLLGVPSLSCNEEALRKWLNVVSLVKPESSQGVVFITGHSNNRVVQSLLKKDPLWLLDHELVLRNQTKLHPSLTTISLTGDLKELTQLNEIFKKDTDFNVLGPRFLEKEGLTQIVVGSRNPANLRNLVRSQIVKFSIDRTKPVRARVNPYDID